MGDLPPQAIKVFEGVIFDVYQWQQTLYDGSKATFEMLKRADTVGVIAVKDDQILLTYDRQPHRPEVVTLPGGRVDPGESILEAAQRELLEETGYQAARWDHYKTFEPSHKIAWQIPFFIARDLKLVAKPNPGNGELIRIFWARFDAFITATKDPRFQNTNLALDLYQMSQAELENFQNRLFGNATDHW